MMKLQRIFEINTLPFLHQIRIQKIDEIPDEILNAWKWKWKFDAVYLMGVWERSQIPLDPQSDVWSFLFRETEKWNVDDITTSAFSVKQYKVSRQIGGATALRKFRQKLHKRGIRLVLDFVPNHTARDHEWVLAHPHRYVCDDQGFIQSGASHPWEKWIDTAQLDYSHPETRETMIGEILEISKLCDGLRCDMAHLVLSSVFSENWKHCPIFGSFDPKNEFWSLVRNSLPKDFLLIAEAYGGHEYRLAELGFNFVYDKDNGFYDRSVGHFVRKDGSDIEGHIKGCNSVTVSSPLGKKPYGDFLLRFLENHDEERAAKVFSSSLFPALELMLSQYDEPRGAVLFYNGQFTGAREKTPVFLKKFVEESPDIPTLTMYEKLLGASPHWRKDVPQEFLSSEVDTSLLDQGAKPWIEGR